MGFSCLWLSVCYVYLCLKCAGFLSCCSDCYQALQPQGDIVEAIQVLHMPYNHDLIFCEPGPSSATELLLEEEDRTGIEAEMTAKVNLDTILDLSDDSDDE